MTAQQHSIRWRQKKSYDAVQPCVLGRHGRISWQVFRVSSLCHHAEGHRHPEPLPITVSHQHFQERISHKLA